MVVELAALEAYWVEKAVEFRRLSVTVSGEAIALAFVGQLRDAVSKSQDRPVTVREAAQLGGYSEDHVRRLVRDGGLRNVGRRYAPRIRRCDVPCKPGYLPASEIGGTLPSTKGQIARSIHLSP
jgi:hypothetical protein